MQRKWLLVGLLLLVEIALCAGIVVAAQSGVAGLAARGGNVRWFTSDDYSATADEE